MAGHHLIRFGGGARPAWGMASPLRALPHTRHTMVQRPRGATRSSHPAPARSKPPRRDPPPSTLRILCLAGSLAAVTLLAAGCGGGAAAGAPSAATLLQRAKTAFDSTSAFHVRLTSSNVPSGSGGPLLTSASGDAVRPGSFRGTLGVELAGSPLEIPVVSIGGRLYAKLPFSGAYTEANPAQYGFGDPGRLLSPTTGISTLLPATRHAVLGSPVRVAGELLQSVSGTLPGRTVRAVLLDAQPSQPVDVTYDIATSTYQVREVVLTGPILAAGHDSTFTLLLTSYGEKVNVTPPAS